MRGMILRMLIGLGCTASLWGQIGWQFTFEGAGLADGKYAPTLRNGTAHYLLEHGYIANLQEEFPALALAEFPFFAIRARDLKGGIFVRFRVDGEWQKSWVIEGWHPADTETRFVDLRQGGAKEVSGVWLNSRSSTAGAEWLLDWLGFVKSENPLTVRVATAGGLADESGKRCLRLDLRNGLGTRVRLLCTLRGLPPAGAFEMQQTLDLALDEARAVDLAAPAQPGARYELRIADRDSRTVYYQTPLTVPPVLEARLVVPGYRNAVYASERIERLAVGCQLNILPPIGPGLSLRARLLQTDTVLCEAQTADPALDARIELPVAGLEPGGYAIEVDLTRASQALGRERLPFRVYGSSPNEVRIDADLNTLVNGQPFLPVGLYSVPLEHLATVAQAGFTAVLTYDSATASLTAYLDEAARVGLMAVVHSPAAWFGEGGEARLRTAVAALRGKPALLGWYLIDEPSSDRAGQTPADLARLYALMQELDPYHPTFTVYCQPAEFALYADTHDVFMCDPYPVGNRPLNYVAEWTDLGNAAMAGRKPVHVVPQSFGSEQGPQTWWRMPTAEEERCMGYLALVHGAKGLFYYRFDVQRYDRALADAGKWPWPTIGYLPDLQPASWAGLANTARELRDLAPVILAAAPAARATADTPALHVALRQTGGGLTLIAVNPTEEPLTARVAVPGLTATRAEVLFEGRQVAVRAGALEDRFEGFAVHVYRFE